MAKQNGRPKPPIPWKLLLRLEPELRSHCYAQIVVGAVAEIHFVAYIKTQTDWASKSFHTYARIKDAVCIALGNAIHRAHKAADRALVRGVEVDESALQRAEETPRAGAGDELRSKQASQAAKAGAVEAGKSTGGRSGSGVALEVIGHLRFELQVTIHVEIEVRADTQGVEIVSRSQPQIVRLHADLAMTIRATFIVPLRDGAGTSVLRCGRGTWRRRGRARSRCSRGGRLLSLITIRGRRLAAGGSLAASRRRTLRRCGALA